MLHAVFTSCAERFTCFDRLGRLFQSRSPLLATASLMLLITAGEPRNLIAAELSVTSDFPGGSGDVLLIERHDDSTKVEITPSLQLQRGWPCWWFVRIDNAIVGQKISLTVRGNDSPFRGTQKLSANWALPQRAAISVDGSTWTQSDAATTTPLTATYDIVAAKPSFWVAWGPPFLSQHADLLLDEVEKTLSDGQYPNKRFELARSRENRPVHAIRFGNPQAVDAIWVQARQHAWESGSSWVADGFVRWAMSDDPLAVKLRQRTEIFFVPVMDVDNVDRGAGGKDATPRDHNRDWADRPVYPEVRAAQTEIKNQIDAGRLRLYIDLHNPAPGDHQPFYFGPLDYENLPVQIRENYDRFLELSTQYIRGPLAIQPRYRFATYVPTAEEQSRVSRNWVGDRIGERGISVTLETAWNTPASTIDGYRDVGRGLAITVSNYLLQLDNSDGDASDSQSSDSAVR
jgi:hypothetical protein